MCAELKSAKKDSQLKQLFAFTGSAGVKAAHLLVKLTQDLFEATTKKKSKPRPKLFPFNVETATNLIGENEGNQISQTKEENSKSGEAPFRPMTC